MAYPRVRLPSFPPIFIDIMDFNKMEKQIDAYNASGEADKFFSELAEKNIIKEKRFRRFEEYLKTHCFEILMYRLIKENGDEHQDKCYNSGYMPYPNNKLQFVFDYVNEKINPIEDDELDSDFHNLIKEFKGYYFQWIWGQGVITRIYNKNKKPLLQL